MRLEYLAQITLGFSHVEDVVDKLILYQISYDGIIT